MTKILVIDDKADNLVVVKAICKKLLPEVEVITALSGKAGINLARKESPDVILLDIIMPELDGYEVCRLIKAEPELSIIPVILVTAIMTNTSARVRGLEQGADAFLNKPINEDELVAQIKVMLRIKKAEDDLRQEKGDLERIVAERTATLSQNERKFRSLYDNSPLPYHSLDSDGVFVDVNSTWLEVLGYPREEIIGHNYADFLHPEFVSTFNKNFPSFKKSGFVVDVYFKIRHQDGHYVDINLNGSMGYNGDGSVKQSYCVFQDVTDRKRAENRLLESELKFKAFTNQSVDGISVADLDGNYTFVNPAFCEMVGWGEAELLTMNVIDVTADKQDKGTFKRTKSVDEGVPVTVNLVRKDRSEFTAEITGKVLTLGDTKRVHGTIRDITERNQMEMILHEKTALLEDAERISNIGSYNLDIVKGIWTSSNILNMIFGITVQYERDVNGWSELIHSEDRERMLAYLTQNVLGNHEYFDREYRIIRINDLEVRWVHGMGELVFDSDGIPVNMVGTIQDITERKQSEEMLRKNESNLKAIIENSLESIWSINTNYEVQYTNEIFANSFMAAFGVKLFRGVNLLQSLPDSIRPQWKERYDRAFKNEHFVFEDAIDLGHIQIYIEVAVTPILLDDEVIGASFFGRDITESRQAEKTLMESEDRYRKVVQDQTEFIIRYLPDGTRTFVNNSYCAAFNLSQKEALEKNLFDGISAEDGLRIKAKIAAINPTNQVMVDEHNFIQKDGHEVWHHWSDRGIFDKKGVLKEIQAIGQNITERKLSEQALFESEAFNKSITLTAPDAIISINDSGLVQSWNTAAERLFGYSEVEMQGKTLDHIVAPQHVADHTAGLKRLQGGGKAKLLGETTEITALRKGGEEFPIELGLSSWTTDENKFFTGIIRDISERKRIEAELKEALLIAEQANDVKDQFVANVSHEIRTPLNSILGFSDLFKLRYSELLKEKDQVIFDYIGESSARLMHTVDSILNISMLRAGTISIHKEIINLNELIVITANNFKLSAEKKNLSIKFSNPDSPVKILADKNCVSSALINLTDNAIKYTNEGSIELKLELIKGQAKLSIIDTGISISEAYRQRIFEPYTQESEGFTKQYQGVGLGLALTKRYLDLNDVKLELVSEKNVGSTFTLTFPKYKDKKNGK
ncbi:MAG: PAS domain S-box protein [Candidatus Marinimicrobia bacterium]|jgi:PAS domain S-box-containing protein|nr:PAS domain S-box protein [Candidatus Neomarinimicrobiota bacterium]MBT3632696.1 PAS domain S-box protein [Candidatus Neomarinimicrobiota bacterium]MBT3823538.1 PAS domain S-box protein [Candidatus Neomarinimicrobiota bacterium]MBT4129618.1 PAS domain S-box protein [Candidatus Neomarinimicrobiota bacterium]MBT4294565.1 PAS domain S-box protein [Candidatus Neomarinimicrobiota bacterium]